MNKKCIMIVFVVCIVNILSSFNSIFASSIPTVGISRPNPKTVYNGGTVVYYVTFENTDEVDLKESDVGKAGKDVTLNKKVEKISANGTKHMYKVTLSNIQGPIDKLVSIAIRKGVAKNAAGVNEQSYKSYAFKIVEKPQPPKPVEPVEPVKPEPPKPVVPEVKPEEKVEVVKKTEVKPQPKTVNIIPEKKEPIKDTTITQTVTEMFNSKVRVNKPFIDKVSEGDIIKYTVEYSNEVSKINLTADKIETVGFTSDIIIREYGRKRVIYLTNIKGSIGGNKNFIIKEDVENNIPEVKSTPSFEIVPKLPVDNSDVIEIPFTGNK